MDDVYLPITKENSSPQIYYCEQCRVFHAVTSPWTVNSIAGFRRMIRAESGDRRADSADVLHKGD